MISIAVIIFREMLEIALITGVLLAATRGVRHSRGLIWSGVATGALGAVLIAYFAKAISSAAQGMGLELFNSLVLLLAAIFIVWTVLWMRKHGGMFAKQFQDTAGGIAKGEKTRFTLLVVMALAVLREGSEIVLFTYGSIASGGSSGHIIAGAVLGLLSGTAAGVVIYFGLVKISVRHLFTVIGWLLVFLAAGMVSKAAALLASVNILPEFIPQVWNSSRLLPESGLLGQFLHAFFGYTERPSGIQLLAYVLSLGGILGLMYSGKRKIRAIAGKIALIFVFIFSPAFLPKINATEKVYPPVVEVGELEIELAGYLEMDRVPAQNGFQNHKLAAGYGINNWWFSEIYFVFANDRFGRFKFDGVEWENRFQLTEPGEWFVDLGLYLAYEYEIGSANPGNIETKVLLLKEFGKITSTLNVILEHELSAASRLMGGTAFSMKYRLMKEFEPGIEWYGDYGELGDLPPLKNQVHLIGPAFYGKIGDNFRYDIACLFGITKASVDAKLKWNLEAEIRF